MAVHVPEDHLTLPQQRALAALGKLTPDEIDEVWMTLHPVEVVDVGPVGAEENRWTSPGWDITGIPNCIGAAACGPDACTCKRQCARWVRVKVPAA